MLRVEVMTGVVDLLTAAPALTGVQITVGHPGDQLKPESIWLEPPEGPMNVPMFTATVPPTYEDNFTLGLQIAAAADGQTLNSALIRVGEMFDAVLDALGPHDVNVDGVMSASLGLVEGPAVGWLERGGRAYIHAVLDIQTDT